MLFLQKVCTSSWLCTSPEATHFALIMPGSIFWYQKILTIDCCSLTWCHLSKIMSVLPTNSHQISFSGVMHHDFWCTPCPASNSMKGLWNTNCSICLSSAVLSVLIQLLLWGQLQFNHVTDPRSDLNCHKHAFGREVIFSEINSCKSQLTPTKIKLPSSSLKARGKGAFGMLTCH